MSHIQETLAPFQVTRERKIALPIALLVSIVVAISVAYARVTNVEDNGKRNADDIRVLKQDQQTMKEILIRIDENVKDLRRTERRNP